MTLDETGLDQLLDRIDVRLDAFAICEIGKHYSLRCAPFERVIVHFVLKGEGFLECEHGRFALRSGTVIVVPPKVAKRLTGVGPIEHVRDADDACPLADGLVSFRAVDASADLVLGCASVAAGVSDELPIFRHLHRPIVEQCEDGMLQMLLAAMLQELRNPRLGTRGLVSALMKQVLILLLRSRRDGESPLLLPMMHARLAGAVATIMQRPQDGHTVESLAAASGMSRARFSHHFSDAYDCSPKAFVQSVRLSSAARLLKCSDLPIKSIAASVGYASRSHFSRAFHAKYGADPSGFRHASRSGAH